MKRVAIWGFYEQGNIGDDLMALMFSDLVREIGCDPIIISGNERFSQLGYTCAEDVSCCSCDAILMGGGAFFKPASYGESALDKRVEPLSRVMNEKSIPVVALSIGSDGVQSNLEISPVRRSIVEHENFKGGLVRLRRDLLLGIENLSFLPDIVLATDFYCRSRGECRDAVANLADVELYNFTKRSIPYIAGELWRARGWDKALFYSHCSTFVGGGEIDVPFMRAFSSDDIFDGLSVLAASRCLTSSKLHPGLAMLSFGNTFRSLAPRDKTKSVIQEYESEGIFEIVSQRKHVTELRLTRDLEWQERLWCGYRNALADMIF